MTAEDLRFVASWLDEPHVARWGTAGTTVEAELEELRGRVSGMDDPARRGFSLISARASRR